MVSHRGDADNALPELSGYRHISLRGRAGRIGNSAVEYDARLDQRVLCAHANAAVKQCIHLCCFQEAGHRPVTAAVG